MKLSPISFPTTQKREAFLNFDVIEAENEISYIRLFKDNTKRMKYVNLGQTIAFM